MRQEHQIPQWLADGAPHVWRPYTQMKTALPALPVIRTEGVRIELADGRVLIDGIASWWTAAHGYNHPHILGAMRAQMERAPHVMFGGLAHEPAYKLATRLASLLPGDLNHVFFAESGSVSVEIAMKMAVQYWINQGVTGRTKFLSFRGGYHGDTFATMMVCDPDEGMHALFTGVLPSQVIADLPRDDASAAALDALLQARGGEIAAILVEPLVQGAGGMVFHDAATLQRLRALADKHSVLLIFDEIFTGFGRTGAMFAMETAGVTPDIVTLSKALTSGVLPLSAAIASTKIFEAFWRDEASAALMHGPTYMANPMGCAAANASLDLFETTGWRADVARIERQLAAGLAACAALPGVKAVRTKGAIGVVELEREPNRAALTRAFIERGCWIRPFGRTLYLTPAFVISEAELAQLTGAITEVVTAGIGLG
ncbi:MAG: adenosylmethionine--8-amino-7-oxononanoate transaminase [Hyphomonadaceae bacterium]|nr:adenosylmethionine--8-amino-7-oxononanoate transaminase [Hyphomonadaceae bacterium]